MIRLLLAFGLLLPLSRPVSAQDTADRQTPTAQQQIDLAVQAAPEALRSSATVLGYDDDGSMTQLRKGDGDLICVMPPQRSSAMTTTEA